MFSPFSNSVYVRLFTAQIVALLGTGLTTVALALLAYDLAGGDAGRVLGTALAIKMVAYVVLAPIAGGLADRLPRKHFLIALDLMRAGFVACLPFVNEIWQIYALILLMQACSAGFTPLFQATIPDILKEEAEYTKALSLSRLAYDIESLLSPTLAAMALLVVSFNTLFAVNAVSFLVSAGLVFSVTLPSVVKPQNREGGFFERTTRGIRYYLATPRLRGLLALCMGVAAAGSMVIVNTVVYVRSHLGLGEQETALALAAFGAGSMAAAFILPKMLAAYDDRPVMICGSLLMMLALGVGVFEPSYPVLLGLWFLIGSGYSTVLVPSGRLLVRSSHEADRPAFYAAQFALSHACWLLTYPLAGWLGSTLGMGAAFAALFVLTLGATLLALWLWPSHDPDRLAL